MVTPAATSARCLNKEILSVSIQALPIDVTRLRSTSLSARTLGSPSSRFPRAFSASSTDGVFTSVTKRFVPLLPRLGFDTFLGEAIRLIAVDVANVPPSTGYGRTGTSSYGPRSPDERPVHSPVEDPASRTESGTAPVLRPE